MMHNILTLKPNLNLGKVDLYCTIYDGKTMADIFVISDYGYHPRWPTAYPSLPKFSGIQFVTGTVMAQSWQLFCDFCLWPSSKMADNMFKLKIETNLRVFNSRFR